MHWIEADKFYPAKTFLLDHHQLSIQRFMMITSSHLIWYHFYGSDLIKLAFFILIGNFLIIRKPQEVDMSEATIGLSSATIKTNLCLIPIPYIIILINIYILNFIYHSAFYTIRTLILIIKLCYFIFSPFLSVVGTRLRNIK